MSKREPEKPLSDDELIAKWKAYIDEHGYEKRFEVIKELSQRDKKRLGFLMDLTFSDDELTAEWDALLADPDYRSFLVETELFVVNVRSRYKFQGYTHFNESTLGAAYNLMVAVQLLLEMPLKIANMRPGLVDEDARAHFAYRIMQTLLRLSLTPEDLEESLRENWPLTPEKREQAQQEFQDFFDRLKRKGI